METHSKAIQLVLPAPELAQGLFAFSQKRPEIDLGAVQVMSIGRDLTALEQTYGFVFQDSYDGLDWLKLALLQLPSGTFVTLERHRGNPPLTTNVSVGYRSLRTFGDAMAELMDVLSLQESEVGWKIDCLRVSLRREFMERHLAALHQADGSWVPLARLKSSEFKGSANIFHICEVSDEGKDVRIALSHFWSGASLALRQTLGSDQKTELCLPERYHDQRRNIVREAMATLELDPQDFLWENP